MVVRCRINRPSDVPDTSLRALVARFVHQSEVDLKIGDLYVVYGIVFWDGIPWYYVCNPAMPEYPVPKFAGFFETVDPAFSAHWRLEWLPVGGQDAQIVPAEWSRTPGFYERLIDGNEEELGVFRKLKSTMDAEAGLG